MNTSIQLVAFTLDEQRYALPLYDVERVVHAAGVTLFPKAPEIVLGVVNVQGRIIPVVNIGKKHLFFASQLIENPKACKLPLLGFIKGLCCHG